MTWAHAGTKAILWNGVRDKVLIPLVASPLMGLVIGFVIMVTIIVVFGSRHAGPTGREPYEAEEAFGLDPVTDVPQRGLE